MKSAIRKHRWDFIAVVAMIVAALGVGSFILGHQRFYLPKWVPVVGSDFVSYRAEFSTAQSLTPGQGQTVDVAGVPVGEISKVELQDGRAVVTMKIRRKYAHVYHDATALLRPKTGLNDMVIALDPGTPKTGEIDPSKQVIPITQTLPNVNTDEFLAALDGDTRDYLKLLLAGGGQGLGDNGQALSATFKRFDPTNRDLERITQALIARRQNVARSIHNFHALMAAVGSKDQQLGQLIDASNAVFKAFADQDRNLQAFLQQLPSTLRVTDQAVQKVDTLGRRLGPTLGSLRPGARALGPSLRQTRPFLRETTPVIQKQLRPFTRDALPTVQVLRPAARDLADLTPDFSQTLKMANYLLNTLAYNPKGSDEGYLFWLAWLNHVNASMFATGDAHGPVRRGTLLVACSSLVALQAAAKASPQIGTLIGLGNLPTNDEVCKTPAATAASASGSAG